MAELGKIKFAQPFTDLSGRDGVGVIDDLVDRRYFTDESQRKDFLNKQKGFFRNFQPKGIYGQPIKPIPLGGRSIRNLPDIREIRSGRGDVSMGMDRVGMFFGGDTLASSLVKLLMTGKLILPHYDYAGGTSGGPESDSDVEDGFIYIRHDYDTGSTDDIRVYVGGAWKSAALT